MLQGKGSIQSGRRSVSFLGPFTAPITCKLELLACPRFSRRHAASSIVESLIERAKTPIYAQSRLEQASHFSSLPSSPFPSSQARLCNVRAHFCFFSASTASNIVQSTTERQEGHDIQTKDVPCLRHSRTAAKRTRSSPLHCTALHYTA